MKDEEFSLKLDTREYAWGTSLENVYLASANRTVYIGHTGINIRVIGKVATASNLYLNGLVIFSVTNCDKIT